MNAIIATLAINLMRKEQTMSAIDRDIVIKKYINPDIEKFHNSDVKIVLENLKQNILKMPSADRPQKKLAEALAPYTTRENLIIADAESKGYAEGFKDGLEADRPQGEWILCSEKLPEYRKTVLISTFWGVKTGFLDSTEAYGDFWEVIEDDATTAPNNVYAWMPLPEPYKGADDE